MFFCNIVIVLNIFICDGLKENRQNKKKKMNIIYFVYLLECYKIAIKTYIGFVDNYRLIESKKSMSF